MAVRARTSGLTAADVDAALDVRALLVSWLNRGTLHLVRSEDYPWLQALTTPQLITGNTRRLRQEGVSEAAAEKGVRTVLRALAGGPLGRAALREALDRAGVRTAGQAFIHVAFLAALRGLVVRGPVIGGEQAFVLVSDWLGPLPPVDRKTALGELGRRYLAGHGPADERDLAKWAGITLGDARTALARRPRAVKGTEEVPMTAQPKLLGAFDPLLHGWVDRTPVTGEHGGIVTRNGIFRPVALVDGRAVATWSMPKGRVELAPFAPFDQRALAAEAADVERFLGSATQR